MELEQKDYDALKAKADNGEKDGKELAGLKDTLGIKDGVTADDVKAMAADGKAYREALVDDYVKNARMLGRCGNEAEAVEKYKGFVGKWTVEDLKRETEALGKEVAAKFPAGAQIPGEDPEGSRQNDVDPAFASLPFFG